MPGHDQFRAAAAHAACDGIDQRFDGAARHAEYVFDADLLQVVDDQVTAFDRRFGFRRRGGWRQTGLVR
jgi:hypothetical protein